MAKLDTDFLAVVFLLLLLPPFLSLHSARCAPILSCSQTPYPEACDYYVKNNRGYENLTAAEDSTGSAFHHLALRAAADLAVEAHRLVSAMNTTTFGNRAKAAWQDCVALYDDVAHLLNRSGASRHRADTQTWLSAARAYQETCRDGFTDFGLASHLGSLPVALSNFSKLLANSLAVNKAAAEGEVRGRRLLGDGGFPEWVSPADRRLLTGAPPLADAVVAQDGSGQYRTLTEAVAAAKRKGRKGRTTSKRFVIYVKAGVYRENVEIKKSVKNVMLIGDGMDVTVVSGSRNVLDGSTTFHSATFAVSGHGFFARDITFENTAGPEKHQAVALRCDSDMSIFYRCSFRGYQDTLYVHAKRQFYRDCDVYGTIDFVFGDAAAVLQGCNLYVRRALPGQKSTVTAQSRSDGNEDTGIVVHTSRVAAAPGLADARGSFRTYLGRPWRKYSRVVFMRSDLGAVVDPAGWLEWNNDFAVDTLYYGEYMNTGAGAGTAGRVRWPGFHVITTAAEAEEFAVGNFLEGDGWILAAGVPFEAGV